MKKFPRNKIMKLYHPQKVIYIRATWEHLLIIQAKNIAQCSGGFSCKVDISEEAAKNLKNPPNLFKDT